MATHNIKLPANPFVSHGRRTWSASNNGAWTVVDAQEITQPVSENDLDIHLARATPEEDIINRPSNMKTASPTCERIQDGWIKVVRDPYLL